MPFRDPEKEKQYMRDYRLTHKKELSEKAKAAYQNNSEVYIKRASEYYKANKTKVLQRQQCRRAILRNEDMYNGRKSLEERRQYVHRWYLDNRERILNAPKTRINNKLWRLSASGQKSLRRTMLKRKHSIKYKLCQRMSSRARRALAGITKGLSFWKYVDYSVEDLKTHIEKQFTEGMTWDRFCSGDIHIDHIRRCFTFNFSSYGDSEFKKCWALENLRPLWAADNLRRPKCPELLVEGILCS